MKEEKRINKIIKEHFSPENITIFDHLRLIHLLGGSFTVVPVMIFLNLLKDYYDLDRDEYISLLHSNNYKELK